MVSISIDKKPFNSKTQNTDLNFVSHLEDHFKTSKATKEHVADMTKVDIEAPASTEEGLTVVLSFKDI